METIHQQIREELRAQALPSRIEFFKKTVPGCGDFFGTPMPVINSMARKYKSHGIPLVHFLWSSHMYEERMLGVKILVAISGKFPDEAIEITRKFAPEIRDWAICDTLGMGVSKALIKKRREQILNLSDELLTEQSFWQRRLGLVLLECFTKDLSMHTYIRERMALLTHEKEHYIRKAIVWLNRAMQSAVKKAGSSK